MNVREAGRKMREVRERLHLRYRDVEEASQWIANQSGNHEFLIGLSRLADIENKGTTPSLFRLYSLCAIYRIEYPTALSWYGITLDQLPAHASHFGAQQTQPFDLKSTEATSVTVPTDMAQLFDPRNTTHLSRIVKSWGRLPVALMNGLEIRKHRYAFIGTEDWSMHPIIPPGSFVQLDEKRRKIQNNGWVSEYERPIYFLEHREGFKCGWCSQVENRLIVQPHHSSNTPVTIFEFPGQVEIVGQVIAVVMRLDLALKRHIHS